MSTITNNEYGASTSYSNDGLRLAVGAPGDDVDGHNNAGSVLIYTRPNINADFTLPIKLTNVLDSGENSEFGSSVALSGDGNILAVGVRLDDAEDIDAGVVLIYRYTGGSPVWVRESIIIEPLVQPEDNFGSSVALNDAGNILLVGAEYANGTGVNAGKINIGAVYVYDSTDPTFWDRRNVLTMTNPVDNSYYGSSVAINNAGDKIGIGARGVGTTVDGAGKTFMYTVSGTSWTEDPEYLVTNIGPHDNYGSSVAFTGEMDMIAIGSNRADNAGENAGMVYFYGDAIPITDFSCPILTDYEHKPLPNHHDLNKDKMGTSLDIGLRALLVGDPNAAPITTEDYDEAVNGEDNLGSEFTSILYDSIGSALNPYATEEDIWLKGSATLYNMVGMAAATRQYVKVTDIYPPDLTDKSFGKAVCLDEVGGSAVISGERYIAGTDYVVEGAVYNYFFSNNTYNHFGNVLLSPNRYDDSASFGHSIAISGSTLSAHANSLLAVGAPYERTEHTGVVQGMVYLYRFDKDIVDWQQTPYATLTGIGSADTHFGHSVAISNDRQRLAVSVDIGLKARIYIYEEQLNVTSVMSTVSATDLKYDIQLWDYQIDLLLEIIESLRTVVLPGILAGYLTDIYNAYDIFEDDPIEDLITELTAQHDGGTITSVDGTATVEQQRFIDQAENGTVESLTYNDITLPLTDYTFATAMKFSDNNNILAVSYTGGKNHVYRLSNSVENPVVVDGGVLILAYNSFDDKWELCKTIHSHEDGFGDGFGTAMGMDNAGTYIAMSSPDYTGEGYNNGVVGLYGYTPLQLATNAPLLNSYTDEFPSASPDTLVVNDLYGSALAISKVGDILIVGAKGNGTGKVFVLLWDNSIDDYIVSATLSEPTLLAGDEFGSAIAIAPDDQSLVVGISKHDVSDMGVVYTYERSGNSWIKNNTSTLTNVTTNNELFGSSVSLGHNGFIMAVGIQSKTIDSQLDVGQVNIYYKEANVWGLTDVIELNDGVTGDLFGSAVALSGDGNFLVIGAPGRTNHIGGSQGGIVYTYTRENFESDWFAHHFTIPDDNQANDNFGLSLALVDNDTVLMVGSPNTNSVYIYQLINGYWTFNEKITTAAGVKYGSSVSGTTDGKTLVIGDEGDTSNTGVVYMRGLVPDISSIVLGIERPTIISPDDHSVVDDINITLVGSAFNTNDTSETHTSSDWLFSTAPDLSTDSGNTLTDTTNLTSYTLSGLFNDRDYYFKVRYKGSNGHVSPYSAIYTFKTPVSVNVNVPVATTITSPTNNEVLPTLTLTITTAPFNVVNAGESHESSDWLISTASDFSVDSGNSIGDTVNKTAYTLPNDLVDGQTYYIMVRHRGTISGVTPNSAVVAITVTIPVTLSGFTSVLETINSITPLEDEAYGEALTFNETGSVMAIATRTGVFSKGYVDVFSFNVNLNQYELLVKLTDDISNSNYGCTVDVSSDGQVIAIGANSVNSSSGTVFVYVLNGSNEYVTRETLTENVSQSYFGTRVALNQDGSILAITVLSTNTVQFYDWNGSTYVKRTQTLTGSTSFGIGLCLSSDATVLIVGEYQFNTNEGRVHVYDFNTSNSLYETRNIITREPYSTYTQFGNSVSISSDKTLLLIGEHMVNEAHTWDGQANLYLLDGSTYIRDSTVAEPIPAAGNRFGTGVSITGDGRLIGVGALEGDVGVTDGGTVYLYGDYPLVDGPAQSASTPVAPTLVSPVNNTVLTVLGLTLTSSAFNVVDTGETQVSADWLISTADDFSVDSGNSIGDTTNLTSYTLPNDLIDGQTYYIKVRHTGSLSGVTPDSSVVTITVALAVVTVDLTTVLEIVTEPVPGTNNHYGEKVALNETGSVMVLSSRAGIVDIYWFDVSLNQYILHSTLPDNETGSNYGIAVALSGDGLVIAIGAITANNNAGKCYIYSYNGVNNTYEIREVLTETGGYFGRSASLNQDGSLLVVGHHNINTTRLFDWSGSTYVKRTQVIPSGHGFASAISPDSTVLIVGDYGYSPIGTTNNVGKVYVYDLNAGTYVLRNSIDSPLTPEGANFGVSVSLSADKTQLYIGANTANNGGTGRGSVYRYILNGNVYGYDVVVTEPTPTNSNYYGNGVGVSGDGRIVAVGALNGDQGVTDGGVTYLYGSYPLVDGPAQSASTPVAPTDLTTVLEIVTEPVPVTNNHYGEKVVFNETGSVMVLSSRAGIVDIFMFDVSLNQYILHSTLPDNETGSHYGIAVALSGDGLVIAIGAFTANNNAGKCYIYSYNGVNNTYDIREVLTETGGYLGVSASLNQDGSLLVVGHYNINTTRLFDWSGSTYVKRTQVIPSGIGFASAISPDSTVLIVGDYKYNPTGTTDDVGKVYVYDLNAGTYVLRNTIDSPLTPEGAQFGASVSLSADKTQLYIGANIANNGGTRRGSLYRYILNGNVYGYDVVVTEPTPTDGNGYGIGVGVSGDGRIVGVGVYNGDQGVTDGGVSYLYGSYPLVDGHGLPTPMVDLTVELTSLTSPGINTSDLYGYSIASNNDGSVIVVSSIYGVSDFGYIEVLDWDVTNSVYVLRERITDTTASSLFGLAVTLSNDGVFLAVSSYSANKVDVYTWNAVTKVFDLIFTVTPTTGNILMGGCALSTDGSILAIGEITNSKVRLFDYDLSNVTYVERSNTITNPVGNAFGFSIAITPDASMLAVGVRDANSKRGEVKVYTFNSTSNDYDLSQTFYPATAVVGDQFGVDVGISGNGERIVAGANLADITEVKQGVVYIYERNQITNMYELTNTISEAPPVANHSFGLGMAINANNTLLLVGAPNVNSGGRVHLYGEYPTVDGYGLVPPVNAVVPTLSYFIQEDTNHSNTPITIKHVIYDGTDTYLQCHLDDSQASVRHGYLVKLTNNVVVWAKEVVITSQNSVSGVGLALVGTDIVCAFTCRGNNSTGALVMRVSQLDGTLIWKNYGVSVYNYFPTVAMIVTDTNEVILQGNGYAGLVALQLERFNITTGAFVNRYSQRLNTDGYLSYTQPPADFGTGFILGAAIRDHYVTIVVYDYDYTLVTIANFKYPTEKASIPGCRVTFNSTHFYACIALFKSSTAVDVTNTLAKLDRTTLDIVWQKDIMVVNSVVPTPRSPLIVELNGNLYVFGAISVNTVIELYVLKVSDIGDIVWKFNITKTGEDLVNDLIEVVGGEVFISYHNQTRGKRFKVNVTNALDVGAMSTETIGDASGYSLVNGTLTKSTGATDNSSSDNLSYSSSSLISLTANAPITTTVV